MNTIDDDDSGLLKAIQSAMIEALRNAINNNPGGGGNKSVTVAFAATLINNTTYEIQIRLESDPDKWTNKAARQPFTDQERRKRNSGDINVN